MAQSLVDMKLDGNSIALWERFLRNSNNLGHVDRQVAVDGMEAYVRDCLQGALDTAKRIKADIYPLSPVSILEVGCSTGLIALAMKVVFPQAEVYGIEPEQEALEVAKSMSDAFTDDAPPHFFSGVGEELPFPSNKFDLVICHTVIEHVQDVDRVISEISRVLKVGGLCHLDAPNYIFPYEPHLQIFTIPRLGKNFVRVSAFMQGKGRYIEFLRHLKFVTPHSIERTLTSCNFEWVNRSHAKIKASLRGGGDSDVKHYRLAQNTLRLASKIHLSRVVYWIVTKLGFYPSLLYTAKKIR